MPSTGCLGNNPIKAVKTLSFTYRAPEALGALFENFRLMCNDAIRICDIVKPHNRFNLIELAHSALERYGLHSHYALSACEVAYSLYRNKKRRKTPRIRRAFLKLDNQTYTLNHLLLRIPATPRNFIFLSLQGSDYHMSLLGEPGIKRGSVTITPETVNVSLSREAPEVRPVGYVGIDINERNVTLSATNNHSCCFSEMNNVVDIRERYREIRSKIGRSIGQDNRVSKQLYAKYGKRERNRTRQRIHLISSQIVGFALRNKFGIKMEKLLGIRKLYRKGNGQGPLFRGRLNTWAFGEIQRQIIYKAKWEGIPTYLVNPRGTSSYCLCGSRVEPLADRKLYCPKCDMTWDRDDLASKRIMACAVPQVRPSKGSDEGERGGDGSNPPSR